MEKLMPDTSSPAALPIAKAVLRVLIVANWLLGAAILVLLFAMPTRQWIMTSLALAAGPEADRVVLGLHAVAVIGLIAIPLHYLILSRLRAMIDTVRAGDPFVPANAARLSAIAWTLLVLQLFSLVVGAIGRTISTAAHPIHLDAGFSVAGWLAVLLTFVLARVFAHGTLLREEIEGTI
jgi:hypothetical protein